MLSHVFQYHGEAAAQEWEQFDWNSWNPKIFSPPEPLPCPQRSGTVRGMQQKHFIHTVIYSIPKHTVYPLFFCRKRLP